MNRTTMRAIEGAGLSIAVPAGWLALRLATGGSFPDDDLTLSAYMLLATLVPFTLFAAFAGRREDRLAEVNRRLDALAVTDPTTGLKNVRYFRARLAESCARIARDKRPVAVAVIDLDRFKSVNDRFGHPIGDRVLKAAACAIASVCRRDETAARVGGEEFAVILPHSDVSAALIAAERIRRAVQDTSLAIEGISEPIRVTASVGVASTDQIGTPDPDALFTAADRALLEAKRGGRNRAVTLPPPPLRVLTA
jgi:two-component system, cell cycle response regulator